MKSLLAGVPLLAILITAAPVFAEAEVPITDNLEVDGELAAEREVPLLVMFYSEQCPYCVFVKEEFLEPMLISGDYTDKVLIRRIDMGSRKLVDFDGTPVSMDDFAARYKVRVTPTLIYVDQSGRELAEKMVGVTTPDFYGGHIDSRIETTLGTLRQDTVRAAARETKDRSPD